MRAESRTLQYALLCSVLLHGWALYWTSAPTWKRSRPVEPAPLVARLVETKPPALPAPTPAPAPVIPSPKAVVPPPKRVAPAKPVISPKPVIPPPKRVVPSPKRVAPPPKPQLEKNSRAMIEPKRAPAPPSPPPQQAPAPAMPAASTPSSPPPAPSSPPSAQMDALADYRHALVRAASRYKTNPHVEGMGDIARASAYVVMVIAPSGNIDSISIAKSAGNAVLDRDALRTLRKAKPLVRIPPALRGKQFSVQVQFIFELKGEEG